MRLLFLVLFGCAAPQVDPKLTSIRSALDYWEAGVSKLEKGQPHDAQVAFKEALKQQPDDPVLLVWWAKSLAESGHVEAAIRVLDGVLAKNPDFLEARYNKAAYLSRLGKVDEAASELKRAMDNVEYVNFQVLDDPDFRDWLDDPAFAFLPRNVMSVEFEGPKGSVFLGDEFSFTLRVFGAAPNSLGLTFEAGNGPVELVAVQEDQLQSTRGLVREIVVQYRVLAPGTIRVGPIAVSSNGRNSIVPERQIEALAPPGHTSLSDDLDLGLMRLPTEILGGHGIPEIWRKEGRVLASMLAMDKLKVSGHPSRVPIKYVHKERGQPKWIVYSWDEGGKDQGVRITRGGELVLSTQLEAPSKSPLPL